MRTVNDNNSLGTPSIPASVSLMQGKWETERGPGENLLRAIDSAERAGFLHSSEIAISKRESVSERTHSRVAPGCH